MPESGPVVVGVDGSDEAVRAVRWAADLATRSGRPLVVLHAWIWPYFNVGLGPAPGGPEDGGLRNLAERTIRDAVAVAREQCPTLDVTGRLMIGGPTVALRQQSEDASAVVIGSQGLGKIGSLLLGSVGVDLAGHTGCPLVVVRGPAGAAGAVVVGVDDSARSHDAIERAFQEASTRRVVLRAVHAWTPSVAMPDVADVLPGRVRVEERRARGVLESALRPFEKRYLDVKVEVSTPTGSAARALVKESGDAELVVVGTRGRGGFRGLVLGSTSQNLLHHARCPVMVVPHADEPAEFEATPLDGENVS
jgi:nucleotide-binding universal stress UspA family protein